MPRIDVEEALAVVAVVLAACAPRLGERWFRAIEARVDSLARRPVLAVVLAGLAPLLTRAILLAWFPTPQPFVQDEFSHLLAADTFAHGHLVNPQHPLWVHFASIHIMVRPVYMSPYPVGIGLILAAGQVLTGQPWIGVWLSVGLMCGGVCWMLQAWVSARWALVGGLLTGLRYGVASYWMNGYFGGALPAFGGALVLGALARIVAQRPQRAPPAEQAERAERDTPQRLWWNSTLFAIGLAILAITRPVEGFLFSLPAACVVLFRARRTAVLVPVLVVLGVTAVGMAYDFARVTGSPLEMPYAFFRSRFTIAPHFIWQAPRKELVYPQPSLRSYYRVSEMAVYRYSRDGIVKRILQKTRSYWWSYLGPILTIPFVVAAALLWRQKPVQVLLLTGFTTWLALAGQVFWNPHYAAPATAVAMALVALGLRHLKGWHWRARPVGLGLSRFLMVACALVLLFRLAGADLEWPLRFRPEASGWRRARILRQLTAQAGPQLVLVRYARSHDAVDEWVYNRADIDAARVVWAHELDPTSNGRLFEYFRDRRVWLVEPDVDPPRLSAYTPSTVPLPFVPPGTEEIEVLRSVDTLKRKILDGVNASGLASPARPGSLTCEQWNSFYVRVTGYEGPPAEHGCYPGTDPSRGVSFDEWFSWVARQR